MRNTPVPKAVQVQLARLFGEGSKLARSTELSDKEWRSALKQVLHELDRYVTANLDSDDLHQTMLASGLYAADQSLAEENFWPGVAEGLVRCLLVMLGDYPDHRKRKTGARRADHYELHKYRRLAYSQTAEQKFATLVAAQRAGLRLSIDPLEALSEFRRENGYKTSRAQFLAWYRKRYPGDYARVF